MPDLTIQLSAAESAGLDAALAAYNSGQTPENVLTREGYVNAMMASFKYDLAQRVNSLPSAAFVLRFKAEEIAAIMAAAESEPALKAYLDMLAANVTINLSNPDAIAGVQFLESAGLIAAGRAAEILQP